MLVIVIIKIWKTFVVQVVWNKPPKIPIPLFKNVKNKLSYVINVEINKIAIVVLENRMDLSCLNVIELDNKDKINEMVNILNNGDLNLHYL